MHNNDGLIGKMEVVHSKLWLLLCVCFSSCCVARSIKVMRIEHSETTPESGYEDEHEIQSGIWFEVSVKTYEVSVAWCP